MGLKDRLESALQQEGPLELHFQPQVDARTGRVSGVEALLRWTDAELGSVPPARFLPEAASAGLMQPLDDWVLDRACQRIAQWHAAGLGLRVAINVSAHELLQPEYVGRLGRCLQRWSIPASLLELELTESAVMGGGEQAGHLIGRIADLGVSIALEDFGTGKLSLSQLRLLPVDRLKLDGRLVQGVPEELEGAALARSAIGIARTLGKKVLAKGVETESQCAFLQREVCDELQGWLFARAVPAHDLQEVIRRIERQASQTWLIRSF